MLNDAVRWQFIRFNPIAAIKPFTLDQQDFDFWTRGEIEKFLAHVEVTHPELLPVFAVAVYTGMRKGELRGLKWDTVDVAQGRITVKRSFCDVTKALKEKTKTKRIRYIPINRPLRDILIGIRRRGDLVLPEFNYHHSYRLMRRLAKGAGVKGIRFHDLRHTFASNFMMAGGSIYDLQKILGHATISMTERYSHLSPQHLIGKTEILDFGGGRAVSVARISDYRQMGS